MSQRAFLADLDDDMHIAMAGMADTGTYTAPGGGPVPARVYVEKSVSTFGDYAPTYGLTAKVTILRADVADPREGGVVAVDGESFTLRQLLNSDDGIAVWGCV